MIFYNCIRHIHQKTIYLHLQSFDGKIYLHSARLQLVASYAIFNCSEQVMDSQ